MKRFLCTEASERLTARNPAEHYILTYDIHSYYPRGNHLIRMVEPKFICFQETGLNSRWKRFIWLI